MDSEHDRRIVVLGEVVKPHGIRGEVVLRSDAESPYIFEVLDVVRLRPKGKKGTGVPHEIEHFRMHKGKVLLTLDKVLDRNAAELVRQHEVLVFEDELPEPDPDDLYLFELPGMGIRLPDGSHLGDIHDVQIISGKEIWVVHTADGTEVLLPAEEAFVTGVDEEEGMIAYDPPPGLIELYVKQDS
jgi:16S rRNA processing protein RimM